MPHHQKMGVHGVDRHGRIKNRFAFGNCRRRHGHVHDICTQALARNLKGTLRAGGGFKEQVDLGLPLQDEAALLGFVIPAHVGLGEVEQGFDFEGGNVINRQQVLAFEKRASAGWRCH